VSLGTTKQVAANQYAARLSEEELREAAKPCEGSSRDGDVPRDGLAETENP
jgi:hypothetical protein